MAKEIKKKIKKKVDKKKINKKKIIKKPSNTAKKLKKHAEKSKSISKNKNKTEKKNQFKSKKHGLVSKSKSKKSLKHQLKSQKIKNLKDEKKALMHQSLFTEAVKNYLSEKYGRKAVDLLIALDKKSSDEDLALKVKLGNNETRALLNKMYEGGLVDYSTKQSKSGWYTYLWNVKTEAIKRIDEETKHPNIPENKDIYVCPKCYESSKILYTFDEAVENKFKCLECGNDLVEFSFYNDVLKNAPKKEFEKSGMGQPGDDDQNARRAHNPKVGGSNPPPAKKLE